MRISCLVITWLLSLQALAQTCDKLSVAGSDQWIPFAYANSIGNTKKPVGIAYDVVDLIGKDLGIPVDIQIGIPWPRIEAMLERGQLDLLAGNYWNEDRAKKWLITESFATDEVRVFVRKDRVFPFDTLSDLKTKRGLIPQGVSFGQQFDAYKSQLNLETVQLHEQMIKMLVLDRADYNVLPLFSGHSKVRSLGYQDQVIALEKPVNINAVHLSLSRSSPCASLLDTINRIIIRRKEDGSLQSIIDAYL